MKLILGPCAAKSTIHGQPNAMNTVDSIHPTIVSMIRYGFTAGTLCESLLAMAISIQSFKLYPLVSQILYGNVAVLSACLAVAQNGLVSKGLAAANRHTSTDIQTAPITPEALEELEEIITCCHQMQALMGVGAIFETALRNFCFMLIGLEGTDISTETKNTIACVCGVAMALGRGMSSSHASCDVKFGKTVPGTTIYAVLTLLGIENMEQFVTTVPSLIFATVYFLAVQKIPEKLSIENSSASTVISNTVALFSALIAYHLYQDFIGQEVRENINNNRPTIKKLQNIFYGENIDEANYAQKITRALRVIIDFMMLPLLTASDAANRLVRATSYFSFSIVPIVPVALLQYVAQAMLEFLVYDAAMNNASELSNTFLGTNYTSNGNNTLSVPTPIRITVNIIAPVLGVMMGWVILVASLPVILATICKCFDNSRLDNNVATSEHTRENPSTGSVNIDSAHTTIDSTRTTDALLAPAAILSGYTNLPAQDYGTVPIAAPVPTNSFRGRVIGAATYAKDSFIEWGAALVNAPKRILSIVWQWE